MEEEVYDNNDKKCEMGFSNKMGDKAQIFLNYNIHSNLSNGNNKKQNVKDNESTVEDNHKELGDNLETEIIRAEEILDTGSSNFNTITHKNKESFVAKKKQVGSSSRHSKRIPSKKNCQNNLNKKETVHKKHKKVNRNNSSNTTENSNNCITSLGSLLLSRKKNYDVKIDPDVIDDYTNKSVPSPPETETESSESPETKKQRIQVISGQCRLHPSNKKYNQGPVINPPLVSPGAVVGYTPAGQRHEVDLNAHRPTWFDSEYSQMQFDYATKINVTRMMHELSEGRFLPDTLDPNVERQYLKERTLVKEDAIRHFESTNMIGENIENDEALIKMTNKMKFLETEQRLTEITELALLKIDDFPNELGKKMRDILNDELSPLMFLKHPIIVEVIEKLSKQTTYHDVAYFAHALYNKVKLLFNVPKPKTFLQYFTSEVKRLDEKTKGMTMFDVALMTEEPNKSSVTTRFIERTTNQVQNHSAIETPDNTLEELEEDTSKESEIDNPKKHKGDISGKPKEATSEKTEQVGPKMAQDVISDSPSVSAIEEERLPAEEADSEWVPVGEDSEDDWSEWEDAAYLMDAPLAVNDNIFLQEVSIQTENEFDTGFQEYVVSNSDSKYRTHEE